MWWYTPTVALVKEVLGIKICERSIRNVCEEFKASVDKMVREEQDDFGVVSLGPFMRGHCGRPMLLTNDLRDRIC